MKIGVFCSANSNIDTDFFAKTEELGQWIGEHGHRLVFGGCDMGLMECVAKSAREAGAMTIGIIPTKVEERGHVSGYVDVQFRCNDLSDRKELLLGQSDILIALPGGIGTLDEIFTVAAAATIGYHEKMVILYNIKDFWAPLISLLDYLNAKGMIRGDWHAHIKVAESIEEIAGYIKE